MVKMQSNEIPSPALQTVLRGDVVCATTLDDPALYAHVQQQTALLGATFVADLSANVTHLVAVRAGSLKHRAVCERNARVSIADRVLVVRPSWLDACAQAALRVSAETHLLPPLTGMEICCSGLTQEEKNEIQKVATDLGAKYNRGLGGSCTHLLCDTPSGKKFEHAATVRTICIVRPRWIHDCARLNLLLGETPFLISAPSDEDDGSRAQTSVVNASIDQRDSRGPSREIPLLRPNNSVQKEKERQQQQKLSEYKGVQLDSLRLYLTESPIREAEKHAPLRAKALRLMAHAGATYIPEAMPALTNFIVALRVPVSSSTRSAVKSAVEAGVPVVPLRWLEECVAQGTVLPASDYPTPDWEFGRTALDGTGANGAIGSQGGERVKPTSNTFKGMRVCLGALWLRDDFAVVHVRNQLLSGRANVLRYDATGSVVAGVPTHIVCAPDLKTRERSLLEDAARENKHVVAVTPFWVDSCVAFESLQAVNSCVLFSPLDHQVPLPGFLKHRVSITMTGFQMRNEKDWNRRREVLSRLAELLGAKYNELMRRRATTHLIVDDRYGKLMSNKLKRAKEWNIHIITHEWLLECARVGRAVPEKDYPLKNIDALINETDSAADAAQSNEDDGEPRTPRRSSRINSNNNLRASDTETISMFQRLQQRLEDGPPRATQHVDFGDSDGNRDRSEDDKFPRRSSRSNSRDAGANDEWTIEASQSQVIVHRDLTPPPTPRGRGRQMTTRSAKRARLTD